MNKNQLVTKIDEAYLKAEVPEFHVGDTISVHTRIIEGNKERIQVFTGTVIGRSGAGLSETFTMHRVAHGEGMERVFVLHSPRIAKIEVLQEGDVRRAKLNYIRGQTGKKAKVKRRVVSRRANLSSKEKKNRQVEVAAESAPAEKVVEEATNEVAEPQEAPATEGESKE